MLKPCFHVFSNIPYYTLKYRIAERWANKRIIFPIFSQWHVACIAPSIMPIFPLGINLTLNIVSLSTNVAVAAMISHVGNRYVLPLLTSCAFKRLRQHFRIITFYPLPLKSRFTRAELILCSYFRIYWCLTARLAFYGCQHKWRSPWRHVSGSWTNKVI